jgi:integrase
MALKPYEVDGKILYQVYVNVRSAEHPGRRAQRKLSGIKTEKDAKREEIRLIRECEREIAAKVAQGSNWGGVVEAWEKYLTSERGHLLNETTRGDYVAAIRKHMHSWWHRAAAEIGVVDVKEVLNQLEAGGASVSYRNKIKVIINRVFVFGIDHGLIRGITRSPTAGIHLGRIEEKKPEILTIAEIRKLLEEAKRLDHPWYPAWALALLTGMRNGELFALRWTDIDWDNRLISVTKSYNCRRRIVKSTKSGNWRMVPISGELTTLLKELKLAAGDRAEVLPRLPGWPKGEQARELRKFCVGIGLPSIKFHTLRACFATQLIRNGVPPIQIQKVCGWKDLETMQRYVRLAGIETDGVTEVLKILPPEEVAAQVINLFSRT